MIVVSGFMFVGDISAQKINNYCILNFILYSNESK